MAKKSTWIPKSKRYSKIQGTQYYGVKLVGSESPRDGGKSAFFVMKETDSMGNGKPLHKEPLTHYPAYMQFQALVVNNPDALKKGKFKLTSTGTLPKALVQILGTDKVAKEIEGVPTLAECKKQMASWGSN